MEKINIDSLVLEKGNHKSRAAGMCVMEAVAYFAGELHSDHPQCACPVLTSFLMSWNDSLPDDERQQLKKYIPLVVGTRGTPELESRRAWMATDWLVREYTPAWLELAGLTGQAAILRGLHELTSGDTCTNIMPALNAIRQDAAAARDAARDAAWDAARAAARDAAWDAAWDAARAAARAAARDAAWDAAWDAARAAAGAAARAAAGAAAWDAAWDAARDAAGAAARDAARDAAWDAAWDAARDAAWDAAWDAARAAAGAAARDAAWAAAWDAAWAALKPTAAKLQASAHGLIQRMIAAQDPDASAEDAANAIV